jgi:hypothetical protein
MPDDDRPGPEMRMLWRSVRLGISFVRFRVCASAGRSREGRAGACVLRMFRSEQESMRPEWPGKGA